MESNQEKFNRIAPTRIENFKVACDRLSKLSNGKYFEFTEDQRKEVLSVIEGNLKLLRLQFSKK